MKIFIAMTLLVSSLFAQNLTIEEIIMKYRPFLMDMQQGMSSVSDVKSSEFEFDQNGDMITVEIKYIDKEIILKKDNDLVYSFKSSKNLTTGEVLEEVALNDYSFKASDYDMIKSYELVGHELSAVLESIETYGDETYITRGTLNKNLRSPMFCNSLSDTNGEWIMADGTNLKFFYKENSQCTKKTTLNELKTLKKKLRSIEFCDYTTQDDDLFCDTQDMSYLLNNI